MTKPSAELGQSTWFSSEEDGGPDVGIAIGLGDGRTIYIGEISKTLWEQHESPLDNDFGWWLVVDPPFIPVAKFVNVEAAREFCDLIEEIARKAARS